MYCKVPYIYHHNQPVVSARNTKKSHPPKEPIMVSTRQGNDYKMPEKTNPSRGGRKRGGGVSSGASAAAAAKKPSRGPRPNDDEEDALAAGITAGVVAALEYAAAGGSSYDSNHGCQGWGIYDNDNGVAFGGGSSGGGRRQR